MKRVHNFSAGPSALPLTVLKQTHDELMNWNNQGASVMEISHRSDAFIQLHQKLCQSVRRVLQVPENYHVLFLHGGANGQFFGAPMNLLGQNRKANYLITGHWSRQATDEAKKYGDINIACDLKDQSTHVLPDVGAWNIDENAAYTYLVSNETLIGLQFKSFPTLPHPLVADMTSDLFAREVDISQFGVVFAGTQKNFGIAGMSLCIVRDDLLDQALDITPRIMHYKSQVQKDSFCNTIPTFPCYMSLLVCEWIEANGGVKAMQTTNDRKAKKIYDIIDQHPLYINQVSQHDRSNCNVSFHLQDTSLTDTFLNSAKTYELHGLKGHRTVGGIRASIYNGVEEKAVDALCEFMLDFAHKHS